MDVKQVEDSENICGVLFVFVKALPYTHIILPDNLQFTLLQNTAKNLNNRQRYTLNLLVDVESKDIGHARDEVDNRHDAGLEVVAIDVVLVAEPLAQLLRVELLRIDGCLGKRLH